jgi:hypothetical protein
MVDFHHIEIEMDKLVDLAPAMLRIRPLSTVETELKDDSRLH